MDPKPKQEQEAVAPQKPPPVAAPANTAPLKAPPVAANTAPQKAPVFKIVKEDEPVTYICGDCGQESTLQPGNIIQCRECGYRVLYKKRTRRIIEYQAR